MKEIPKKDGSGKGRRLNIGRGGCKPPKNKNVRDKEKELGRRRNRR